MKLSGVQRQALRYVAYRDVVKPTRRALGQLREMGLVTSPTADDANWRLTQEGGRVLRSEGLAKDSANARPFSLPSTRQGAA